MIHHSTKCPHHRPRPRTVLSREGAVQLAEARAAVQEYVTAEERLLKVLISRAYGELARARERHRQDLARYGVTSDRLLAEADALLER